MEKFLNLVISGAVAGAIYSIMAAGLVLTYQTSGIFNFAHGAVAFVTAYVYFQLHESTANGGLGWPIVPAAIVAILVFAPLLGLAARPHRCCGASPPRPCTRASSAPSGCSSPSRRSSLFLVETVGNEILDLGLPVPARRPPAPRARARTRRRWCGGRSQGVAVNSNQMAIFAAAAASARPPVGRAAPDPHRARDAGRRRPAATSPGCGA